MKDSHITGFQVCTTDQMLPPRPSSITELEELMLAIKFKKTKLNALDQSIHETKCKDEWDQYYLFPRLYLSSASGKKDENHIDPFVLQPSLFHKNHVPPTIYFNTKISDDSKPPIGLPKSLQSLFRWKISSITPNSIRHCISFMKFEQIKAANTTDNLYLGSWCKHMLTADFGQLEPWRKVNHYPGSFHLGRKDKLWLRLKLADQRHYNENFNHFHPKTFVLPKDYEELKEYWSTSPSKLFIIKPPASARGNGIKVINNIAQVPSEALEYPKTEEGLPTKKSTMIVQQYISNPCLLENGQKFDLRVYVLVTSVDPLRIYVNNEGLVRFASMKYTSQEDGIIDQYMHLTNYFVNKNSIKYQVNNDCDSSNGCKWTLQRFWRYLKDNHAHVDTDKLWNKIIDIIVRTIISCEGPMTRLSNQNCKNDYTSFELFGFDIILDENFKPWILEVNITPSLKSESDLDTQVKYQVIKDMFNLVGYNLPPPAKNVEPKSDLGANCRLWFDERLYKQNLSKRDRAKHSKYQKLFKTELDVMQKSCNADEEDWISILADDGSDNENPNTDNNKSTTNGYTESPKNDVSKVETKDTPDQNNHDNEDGESQLMKNDCVLSDLSQDDIRVLMLAEDELSRCGTFRRAFPSSKSNKYLKYFEKPRYYNLLLDAWERRYHNDRVDGIRHLSYLANFLN